MAEQPVLEWIKVIDRMIDSLPDNHEASPSDETEWLVSRPYCISLFGLESNNTCPPYPMCSVRVTLSFEHPTIPSRLHNGRRESSSSTIVIQHRSDHLFLSRSTNHRPRIWHPDLPRPKHSDEDRKERRHDRDAPGYHCIGIGNLQLVNFAIL
jgi:hypothetical protein